MAVTDERLSELAAMADRGGVLPQSEVVELVREVCCWRARFAEVVAEALQVKRSADRCIAALDARYDRELAALRHQNRQLAECAVSPLGTLEYAHDLEC